MYYVGWSAIATTAAWKLEIRDWLRPKVDGDQCILIMFELFDRFYTIWLMDYTDGHEPPVEIAFMQIVDATHYRLRFCEYTTAIRTTTMFLL